MQDKRHFPTDDEKIVHALQAAGGHPDAAPVARAGLSVGVWNCRGVTVLLHGGIPYVPLDPHLTVAGALDRIPRIGLSLHNTSTAGYSMQFSIGSSVCISSVPLYRQICAALMPISRILDNGAGQCGRVTSFLVRRSDLRLWLDNHQTAAHDIREVLDDVINRSIAAGAENTINIYCQ